MQLVGARQLPDNVHRETAKKLSDNDTQQLFRQIAIHTYYIVGLLRSREHDYNQLIASDYDALLISVL